MSEETIAALTPEEWGALDVGDLEEQSRAFGSVLAAHTGGPLSRAVLKRNLSERRFAAAALALEGHPQGFTWRDVDALRFLAGTIDRQHPGGMNAFRAVQSIADRIAALLPPRTS